MQGYSPLDADKLGDVASGRPERRFARGMRDRRWNKQGTHGSATRGRHPGKSGEWKRLRLARSMQQAVLRIAQAGVFVTGVTMMVITRVIDRSELYDRHVVSYIVGEAFRIETPYPEACQVNDKQGKRYFSALRQHHHFILPFDTVSSVKSGDAALSHACLRRDTQCA